MSKRKNKAILSLVFVFSMILNLISPGIMVYAEDVSNSSSVEIISATFDDYTVREGMIKTLRIDYKIKDPSKITPGDSITITLPKIFRDVKPVCSDKHFSGQEYNPDTGVLKLIFNDNIKNALEGYLSVTMVGDKNIKDGEYPIVINTNGDTETVTLTGEGREESTGGGSNPLMYKGSYLPRDSKGEGLITDINKPVRYYVEINRDQNEQMGDAYFEDQIPEGMVLDKNSISIIQHDYESGVDRDITNDLLKSGKLIAEKDSLKIDLGDIYNDSYSVNYNTLILPNPPKDIRYVNKAKLTYNGKNNDASSTVKLAAGAGAINVYKTVNKTNITNDEKDQNIEYKIAFDSAGHFLKNTMHVKDKLDSRLTDIKIDQTGQFTVIYNNQTKELNAVNDKADINPGDDAYITIQANMKEVGTGEAVSNTAYVNGNPTDEVVTIKSPKVEIIKIEKGDKIQKMLSGAVYSLTDSNSNPVKDVYGQVVKDITTSSNSPVELELPYGNYKLVEKIAPKGYKLDSTPITFEVTENSKIVKVVAEDELIATKGKVVINKTDEDGKVLEGATFNLVQNGKIVDTKTTNSQGIAIFDNVKKGNYQVVEVKAPEGYNLAKNQNIVVEAEKINTVKVVDTKIKGSIEITKVDSKDTKKVLAGTEFTIFDSSKKEVTKAVTGKDGKAVFKNLAYGNYYYQETKASEGYTIDNKMYPFEIAKNNQVIEKTVANDKIVGSIEITKVDSKDTKKVLAGTEFTIFDSNKKEVSKAVTGKDGKVVFKNLAYGNYYYQETKAPEGYTIDNKMYPFEIATNNQVIEKTAANDKIVGSIEITKVDSKDAKKVLEGTEFTIFDSNKKEVAKAVTGKDGKVVFKNLAYGNYYYQETKAPEGYTIDNKMYPFEIATNNQVIEKTAVNNKIVGSIEITKVDSKDAKKVLEGTEFTIFDSNKKEVAKAVTGKDGKVVFKNLAYGNYYYQETKAPEGYTIDNKMYPFEIATNNQVIEKTAVNNKIVGSIEIIKVDSKDAKKVLEGTEFTIFDSNKKEVAKAVTGKDGKVVFKNLAYGNYYYQETKAPEGYTIDNKMYPFEIATNNQVIEKTAVNNKIVGSIEIIKVDSKDAKKVLAGTEFTIFDSNKKEVSKAVTGKDGKVVFKNLAYGNYYYQETKASEGYTIENKMYPFEIATNNQVIEKTVANDKIVGSIEITKVDSKDTKKVLEGTEFTIFDSNKKEVSKAVTGKDGKVVFKNLAYGNYYYQETKASEGYTIDNKMYPFEIAKNNQVIEKTVANDKIVGSIEITKVDSKDAKKVLEGTEFTIFDSNKKEVAKAVTGKDGKVVFKNLAYGNYYYQETKASEGYTIDNKMYPFEIATNNQVIEKTVTNEEIYKKADENEKPKLDKYTDSSEPYKAEKPSQDSLKDQGELDNTEKLVKDDSKRLSESEKIENTNQNESSDKINSYETDKSNNPKTSDSSILPYIGLFAASSIGLALNVTKRKRK